MSSESWEVIESNQILQHPHITVAAERIRLPNRHVIPDWLRVQAGDYVNVFVINETRQAMILEGYRHGLGRSSWQLVGGYVGVDENPLAAAGRMLLKETGHESKNWRHLGSFVVDANRHIGVGHLFLACSARAVTNPAPNGLEPSIVRWVSLRELKRALWDGRVAGISYATNISLGLLALSDLR